MAQPPPSERSENAEESDPKPMAQFKALASRLLRVSRDEIAEQEAKRSPDATRDSDP